MFDREKWLLVEEQQQDTPQEYPKYDEKRRPEKRLLTVLTVLVDLLDGLASESSLSIKLLLVLIRFLIKKLNKS